MIHSHLHNYGDDVEPFKVKQLKNIWCCTIKRCTWKTNHFKTNRSSSTFTDVVRSQNTVTNQKISGIQPVQGDFSNIGDGGKGKMPKGQLLNYPPQILKKFCK